MPSRKCFTMFFCDAIILFAHEISEVCLFSQNEEFKLLLILCSYVSKLWFCFVKNMNSFLWLQISFINSFTPYSHGNVTFSILTPGPNHRPGYNDFYNTPSLQEFVKATQIRLHFYGQYYTTETPVSLRHRYYAVDEITITGR